MQNRYRVIFTGKVDAEIPPSEIRRRLLKLYGDKHDLVERFFAGRPLADELVNLSENEQELAGVLLHEIAHVKERHALRTVIQNAGIFLVIAALSGDLSEISSTAASLPTLLAHSRYSRTFEREADRFAALSFVRKGWSIGPMQNILRRMSKDIPKYPGESVLSTHPAIEERLAYLEALSRNENR